MAKSPTSRRSIIERPSTAIIFLLIIFAIGLSVGGLIGKFRPPPPPATTQVLVRPSTDPTRFADGDRIQIYFSDLSALGSETTRTFTIDEKGTIPIPRLGALMARGHTAGEIEETVSKAYHERGYASSMRIEVTRPAASTAPSR